MSAEEVHACRIRCEAIIQPALQEEMPDRERGLKRVRAVGDALIEGYKVQPKTGARWAFEKLGMSRPTVATYKTVARRFGDLPLATEWALSSENEAMKRLAAHSSADSIVRLLRRYDRRNEVAVKCAPSSNQTTTEDLAELRAEIVMLRRPMPKQTIDKLADAAGSRSVDDHAREEIRITGHQYGWLFADFLKALSSPETIDVEEMSRAGTAPQMSGITDIPERKPQTITRSDRPSTAHASHPLAGKAPAAA